MAARLLPAEEDASQVGKLVLQAPRPLEGDGTVLVTGGLGELGQAVARHLICEHGVGHLLLTSRPGTDAQGAPELVAFLESLGAQTVTVAACDVAERAELASVLAAIPASRPLTGVFHLAGVLDDSVVTELTPERLDILQRTMPSHTLDARPVDLFDENLPRIWHVRDDSRTPRLDVVGLFNWDGDDYAFDIPAARLGLSPEKLYVAFDYWANELVGPFKGKLASKLPKHTCQMLAIREVADRPLVLSTSRHIMQGVVDISAETWDAKARTLGATSKVVAGDAYEVRVLTRSTAGAWKAASVELSEADVAAGAAAKMKVDGEIVRVTIDSKTSREVAWKLVFECQ